MKSPCSAPAEELPSCVSSSSILWMSFLGFHLDNVNLSIDKSADRCFLLHQRFPDKTFCIRMYKCIKVLIECMCTLFHNNYQYNQVLDVRWKGALMVAMYRSANSSVAMSLYLAHGCNPRIYGMHTTDIYIVTQ